MNKAFIFIASVLMIGLAAHAQEKELTKAWKYTGIVQVGLIGGASEANYALQTIQGITKGNWMIGAGAGLDRYVQQSIPLVAHGQYAFGKRKSRGFLYAQAGPQIPIATGFWKDSLAGFKNYHLKTGWLAESGIGYGIKLGAQTRMLLSLGYSIKQARYNQLNLPMNWWASSRWPRELSIDDISNTPTKLNMNRLVLKAGIQF